VIPPVALDSALVAALAVTGAAAGGLALLFAALAMLRVRQLGRTLRADDARAHGGDLAEGGRLLNGARHDSIGRSGRLGRPNGARRRDARDGIEGREGRDGSGRLAPITDVLDSVDLRTDVDGTSMPSGAPICNVAVVRYNAFPDIGGQMSFSAALLDEVGDGLVLTVINGRNESRTYAKDIREGTSVHRLSDDEIGAIDQALGRARQP